MEKRQSTNGYGRYLRSLDAFSRMMKVPEDLRTQSTTGGTISLISFTIIVLLFLSELFTFLTPERSTTFRVDDGINERLSINLDIDFPKVNCEIIGIDALDIGGSVQIEIENNLYKMPIDHNGKPLPHLSRTKLLQRKQPPKKQGMASPSPWPHGCGSCMGAQTEPNQCCNTCNDVKKAYEKRGWLLVDLTAVPHCVREGITTLTPGEYDPEHGCNIHGQVEISKVAGRIQITPGHSFEFNGKMLHDMGVLRNHRLDLSHKIKKLSFGQPYPGQVNALDGAEKVAIRKEDELGMHEYLIRVVPTTYKYSYAKAIRTNQYSQTYFFKRGDPMRRDGLIPGVFLSYELNPIHIEVTERRKSLFHFIVQLCAIIGGVFTVASMFSTFMDDVVIKAMKKRQVGKLM